MELWLVMVDLSDESSDTTLSEYWLLLGTLAGRAESDSSDTRAKPGASASWQCRGGRSSDMNRQLSILANYFSLGCWSGLKRFLRSI